MTKKIHIPTEEERLENYFCELYRLIPEPPKDWEKLARPCRWAKMLEEKKNNPNGPGR